jgi:hypothetical protein
MLMISRNIPLPASGLKCDYGDIPRKTSALTYKITRCHSLEGNNVSNHRRQNSKIYKPDTLLNVNSGRGSPNTVFPLGVGSRQTRYIQRRFFSEG